MTMAIVNLQPYLPGRQNKTMKAILLLFLTTALIFMTSDGVLGCSCRRGPLRDIYGSSHFVVIGKVLHKRTTTLNGSTYYIVQLSHIFKGRRLLRKRIVYPIKTAGIASLCGVNLSTGQEYVLNGRYSRGGRVKLTITSCGMMMTSPITYATRDFVIDALSMMQTCVSKSQYRHKLRQWPGRWRSSRRRSRRRHTIFG